jgi:hypothetical protein
MRVFAFGRMWPVTPQGKAKAKILSSPLYLVTAPVLALPPRVLAGPPFVTDDPVPVDYQHWEVYLAS